MLESENVCLSKVSFPLKRKQAVSMASSISFNDSRNGNNFNALDWYAEEPVEEDILYKVLEEEYHMVDDTLNRVMDEHGIEKNANAGPSTQYLLLVSDEYRAMLTIDQVLALYLIDIAERCKKCHPILTNSDDTEVGNP